nr:ABC transporter ATP-binding protein [Dehalococcoides mccartyi]
MNDETSLIKIENLCVTFPTESGIVQASSDINLSLEERESLCLVGESGCGKTVVALSTLNLLPSNARITGQIWFKGDNILSLSDKEMQQRIRGRQISIIFEQPATCLNPVIKVGKQIAESISINGSYSKKEVKETAIKLMEMVGIASPNKRLEQYPHEFSGGMQQRVMIAMALASRPSLLIADEPTTSLDMTIQAQIMELLKNLTEKFNTSLFLITHDLGVAAQMCERVAVMYAGEIVETGKVVDVFQHPKHPYTQALIQVTKHINHKSAHGTVPELTNLPNGCRFHPRCPYAENICKNSRPPFIDDVRCHLWQKT